MNQEALVRAMIRVRLSESDVHYGGGLVSGAHIMGLFGDVATELLIRHDGDEGLFVAYDLVEFRAPVHAGDFLEVHGTLDRVGNTSRTMSFRALKVIASATGCANATRGEVLDPPLLVARAHGTCVVPADRQRNSGSSGGDRS